ncbi:hypothetical protein G3I60_43305 [Streptomyces sp. SID13666]|uniref:Arm DNA-binding domain-containing protein n=1 Tax=Streptomyces sp. SID13666 TaxID=2706054 RepID=UPI0013C0709F|nr:hypothetical protein [Streptomyces sp. SID13666]NEA73778.1 hypothetical protein [Streptomyces sp. SID13588]
MWLPSPQRPAVRRRLPAAQRGCRHGSWAFAVDLPSTGRRRPKCRSGFLTRRAARAALEQALEAERTGLDCEPDLTVAAYLITWLRGKQEQLRPTSLAGYRDHVHRELIPAFGTLLLGDLRPRHIASWCQAELDRGRGRTTV